MSIPAGTVIDSRYKVVRLLGEGGYGAVYLAEDTRLGDKPIALKESFDKSPPAQEQFQLEAQLLAKLSHPNLPRVTDHFGEKDGRQFLVMDYIEGEDLDERVIRQGRALPDQEAASLMLQICEAVAYLHTRKPQPIIHRDIKPGNIKITREGRAILVDFGIAKIYNPSRRTAKIAKAITPHFSSPEQHLANKTDTRSDVYSLGATLYAVVTADLPTDALDRLNSKLLLAPPHQLNPAVSPVLEKIIFQALELSPDRRFQNANRMAAALRAFLQGQPVPAPGILPGSPVSSRIEPGKICPQCGWINRASARFCVKDGTPLEVTAPGAKHISAPAVSHPPAPPAATAPKPQALDALFEKANALARKQEYVKAIPLYETCVKQDFGGLAAFYNLGICYLEANRFADAAGVLEKGVTRDPKDADFQYHLARAYTGLNLRDLALTAAARACQLTPNDASNLRQYGRLLFEAKRYSEAAQQFEKAVQLDTSSASAYVLLGRAHGEVRNFRLAVEALKKASQLEPQAPEPHYWMGVYYLNARKRSLAKAALEHALQVAPNYQPAQDLLKRL